MLSSLGLLHSSRGNALAFPLRHQYSLNMQTRNMQNRTKGARKVTNRGKTKKMALRQVLTPTVVSVVASNLMMGIISEMLATLYVNFRPPGHCISTVYKQLSHIRLHTSRIGWSGCQRSDHRYPPRDPSIPDFAHADVLHKIGATSWDRPILSVGHVDVPFRSPLLPRSQRGSAFLRFPHRSECPSAILFPASELDRTRMG